MRLYRNLVAILDLWKVRDVKILTMHFVSAWTLKNQKMEKNGKKSIQDTIRTHTISQKYPDMCA